MQELKYFFKVDLNVFCIRIQNNIGQLLPDMEKAADDQCYFFFRCANFWFFKQFFNGFCFFCAIFVSFANFCTILRIFSHILCANFSRLKFCQSYFFSLFPSLVITK